MTSFERTIEVVATNCEKRREGDIVRNAHSSSSSSSSLRIDEPQIDSFFIVFD